MRNWLCLAVLLSSLSLHGAEIILPPQDFAQIFIPPAQVAGSILDSSSPGIFGQTILMDKRYPTPSAWSTSAIPACLTIYRKNGRLARVVTSNRVGHYHCFLEPGEYAVWVRPLNRRLKIESPGPFRVNVKASELSGIDIRFYRLPSNASSVCVGGEWEITLPANHSTGYQWQLAKGSELLQWMGTEYSEFNTGVGFVGASGFENWRFKALAVGQTELQFVYIQPWMTNLPPLVTTNIPVTVSQAISRPCSQLK